MGKLARFTQYLFGTGSTNGSRFAVFGSLQSGSPVAYAGSAITPALVQQNLAGFQNGWDGAAIGVAQGAASPAIQDTNALDFLTFYQLCYLYQMGIPEYDGSTTYYSNSILQSGGSVYVTTYGSASGVSGQSPPNATYYSLLYGVSPFNPGGTPQILMFGSGSAALPQPTAQITRPNLPTVGQQTSASSGAFTTTYTAGSFVNVTNGSVTITTTGRPVMIGVISAGLGTGSPSAIGCAQGTPSITQCLAYFNIQRDGSTDVATWEVLLGDTAGNLELLVPPGHFHLDTPAAGTHTYVFQAKAGTLSTALVQYCALTAYEL